MARRTLLFVTLNLQVQTLWLFLLPKATLNWMREQNFRMGGDNVGNKLLTPNTYIYIIYMNDLHVCIINKCKYVIVIFIYECTHVCLCTKQKKNSIL